MDFVWIFLIIAVVVYFILRYYPRKQKPRKSEMVGMDSLGFIPVDYPEAVLKKKVIQLHTKYDTQQLALHDVFKLENESDWVYLFDIEDNANKEPYTLAQDVIGVISPGMNTPRINIFTRPNTSGRFGGVVDHLMSRLADWENNTQNLKKISFDDHPEIDERFFVFSPMEEQARTFLDPERLNAVESLSQAYAIEVGIDTLTLHQTMPDKNLTRRQCIEQTLQDALALSAAFKTQSS